MLTIVELALRRDMTLLFFVEILSPQNLIDSGVE